MLRSRRPSSWLVRGVVRHPVPDRPLKPAVSKVTPTHWRYQAYCGKYGWDGNIYVIRRGRSTPPLPKFLVLLAAHGIRSLIDVRTIPKSRHNPRIKQDVQAFALPGRGHCLPAGGGAGTMGEKYARAHKLTPLARANGLSRTYPPEFAESIRDRNGRAQS